MNNSEIRSLYGLKYNPFLPDVPSEALFTIPGSESFAMRVQTMAAQGGFALIAGDPGVRKSKTLHQIAHRLEQTPDLLDGQPLCGSETGEHAVVVAGHTLAEIAKGQ